MIRVDNIHKSFIDQHVLKGISFEIPSGGIVGFLGPNGAGKSTTMKIITGFLQPDSGSAYINNQKVSAINTEVKKLIGYLPEHNPLYPEMYVQEYLVHIAKLYKLKNVTEQVGAVIEQTGLIPEKHKKIKQLSKGYKQRVGLAQAIIHNPEILILDEPTSGLDPNQIVEIRNLITELGRNKTIMLSTHIMQEVEAMCQRVIIVNKGEVVEDLPIENQMLQKTQINSYCIGFNKKINDALLSEINWIKHIEKSTDGIYEVQLEPGYAAEHLFDFAVSNHLKIVHLNKHTHNIESIFRTATKTN